MPSLSDMFFWKNVNVTMLFDKPNVCLCFGRVSINFEKVHRIGSIGLGVLIEAHVTATQKKGRIGIIHLGKHIRNVIVINRLVRLFELFDSEDAAVSALSA